MKKLLQVVWKKESSKVAILIVLGIAAFVRMYRINDYMTFLGDEGRDALVVYNILHGKFTLLGPTASVGGFFYGPFYFYLIAPFYFLFNFNPTGASVFVAILSLITIWLMYKMGNTFFGKPVGILAGVLYALAPVVIIYSRASWNPNVTPFFSILLIYTLYYAVKKNNFLLFFLTGVLYGFAIQLHYTELMLGLVIILYPLFVRFVTEKKGAIGKTLSQLFLEGGFVLLGFIIGFSQYILFELRHQFANTRSIVNFVLNPVAVDNANPNPVAHIGEALFALFGRVVTNFPTPVEYRYYDKSLLTAWLWFIIFLMILSFAGFIVFYAKAWREKKEKLRQMTLLLLWFVCSMIFFGIYKKATYDYYLENLFPVPFLLIASSIWLLWKKNFGLKILGIATYAVILGIHVYFFPLKYEPNMQLSRTREVARFTFDKTEGKPYNFALITPSNSDHAYRYFFTLWGNPPVTIENSQNDPERKTVTRQLLVICEQVACSPLGNSLWEIAGFGADAKIQEHWKLPLYDVYRLVHGK